MSGAIFLFTREMEHKVVDAAGTGNWATRADRVREYPYVVLVRNRRHPSSPSDYDHGTAFLVGKVSGTRETGEFSANGRPRVFIEISAYAPINMPKAWRTESQNPVWYTDLATLGIAENDLQFQPVPHQPTPRELAWSESVPRGPAKALAEIKREIARLLGVPVSAVEIHICC
jgi:hypothetical protein